MKLLADVVSTLDAAEIEFALIGAAAMAVHGVARSTQDLDLLTTDSRCLQESAWQQLRDQGARVEIRRGDLDDPLAGVIQIVRAGARPVDLVIGKHRWQDRAIERAGTATVGDRAIPVVSRADLVLLKLYAGGTQDAWDIHQLLASGDRSALVSEIERDLGDLPRHCRTRWRQIVSDPED